MRLRRSRALTVLATTGIACAMLTSCAASDTEVVTFRLWDPQVAQAYEESFEQFENQSGIRVDVVVVPWADYAAQLRADLAAGLGDDVFWVNATMAADLVSSGSLREVSPQLISEHGANWAPPVTRQFTFDQKLWGVPQLSDPGIAMIVNLDVLAARGIEIDTVANLRWDPTSEDDSLRSVARALTADREGRSAEDASFDPGTTVTYGYGVSNDLNAILLPYLGSGGAAWQQGDRFVFASPEGEAAIGYVVDLINEQRIAPPASETNPPGGGDVVRDLFLQGRVAMFQTGAYNLANILENATFDWTIVPIPAGPAGRLSPTNGIVAAANSATDAPVAQERLLEWLGSDAGQAAIGESGTASPAALGAQVAYRAFWSRQGVDLSPMYDVLEGDTIQPPQGSRYTAAANAMRRLLNDLFLGRLDVRESLTAAQQEGNDKVAE